MVRIGWVVLVVAISVVIGLGLSFPKYTSADDEVMLAKYNDLRASMTAESIYSPFPVMSFNMRIDGKEYDANNMYDERVPRINSLFRKWDPYVVGVQEPVSTQIIKLKEVLPEHYEVIGHERNGTDIAHPSRHWDYRIAIFYNNKVLKLLEHDYIWLSTTPRIEASKDWKSHGAKSLNIARFSFVGDSAQEVIVFNTHLDRWGEWARREQSKVISRTIQEWRERYPNAFIILLGDFNTVPGQQAHITVTSSLTDSWIWCKENHEYCTSNDFAASYHSWYGTVVNSWIGRMVITAAFTLHGMGIAPPHGKRTLQDVVNDFVSNLFPITEAFPSYPLVRLHVDWILFNMPKQTPFVPPKFMAVVDVKNSKFSSDHFPVVVLFGIKSKH